MEEQQLAKDNLILKVTTGSHLYGTNTEESDWDYQGIFIPPKEYVIGIHTCEQVIVKGKNDSFDYTCYTLPKYFQLARANNPNILSMLYTPERDIHFSNEYGREIIKNRHLFLSKKSYHTFRGYAHSQRHKILSKDPIGKRKDVVDKYGYDTKFAMHLIRLLYEAIDIMVAKEIIYPATNRKVLNAIRNGEWTLEQVLSEAIRLEKLVDESYVRSDLQYSANDKEIEKLQIRLLEQFWNETKSS